MREGVSYVLGWTLVEGIVWGGRNGNHKSGGKRKCSYQIKDGRGDDGVESGGVEEIEQAIKATKGEGEDGGADGEIIAFINMCEKCRIGESALRVFSLVE